MWSWNSSLETRESKKEHIPWRSCYQLLHHQYQNNLNGENIMLPGKVLQMYFERIESFCEI